MGPRHCVCTAERWTRDRTSEANGGMCAAPTMCVWWLVVFATSWESEIEVYDFPIFCWCQFLLAVPLLHGQSTPCWLVNNPDIDTKLLTPWRYVGSSNLPVHLCPLLKTQRCWYLPQEICRKTWNWKPSSRLGRFGVSSCAYVYRRYDLMEFFCYDGFLGLQKAQERHDV